MREVHNYGTLRLWPLTSLFDAANGGWNGILTNERHGLLGKRADYWVGPRRASLGSTLCLRFKQAIQRPRPARLVQILS